MAKTNTLAWRDPAKALYADKVPARKIYLFEHRASVTTKNGKPGVRTVRVPVLKLSTIKLSGDEGFTNTVCMVLADKLHFKAGEKIELREYDTLVVPRRVNLCIAI